MIVSYHPLFEADKNLLCAGRRPDATDLAVIQNAVAVIVAQGCYQSLYEMARANCPNVFPNYDARFKYPGKLGQIKLFREFNAPHPSTAIYPDVATFNRMIRQSPAHFPSNYPLVFKLDWGGEGETVYCVDTAESLRKLLTQSAEFENSGQTGFLIQEYIPAGNKTLRVVVIGQRFISYWRIQQNINEFQTNLRRGAIIDSTAQPDLQQKAVAAAAKFCRQTNINLAGFDLIFSAENANPEPMLLEINYFFGRKGLGGSEAYYLILQEEIRNWLDGIG